MQSHGQYFCNRNFGMQSNEWAGFVLNFKNWQLMHLKKDFWHCGMRLWFLLLQFRFETLPIPRTWNLFSCYFSRHKMHASGFQAFDGCDDIQLLSYLFLQRFGIHFDSERTFNAFYDSNHKFYCITFGIDLINVFGDKTPFTIGAASIKR